MNILQINKREGKKLKIKNIKINAYGTLKEKEINLKNNINIIYGKNESGKSTLLNFIKNTFYGISKNKNGKEISDYEKYLPWTGENFSGKIEYELDNKKSFEIFRDFHKKNPKLFNDQLEDISHEFKIDKKDGNQFFYEQTGVTEQTYISTIMAPQQEVVLDKTTQNILVQKIANLGGTGEESVSFQKAMDKLNKRQVEEVGTARTQDRPINLLQNRQKQIEFDLKDEKTHFENKQNLQDQKERIKHNLEQEKQKNNLICELNKLNHQKEIELEKINLKEKIKNENEQKLKNIIVEKNNLLNQNSKKENYQNKKEQKNTLNKKIKTTNFIFASIFILLIIINILNFIFIKNKIINYSIIILPIIEIIIFAIYNLKKHQKIKSLENELITQKQNDQKWQEQILAFETQINLLNQEITKTQNEIQEQNNQILSKINNEKQNLKQKYNSINEEIFELQNQNQIEELLKQSNQKIMNYQLQLNSLQFEEVQTSEQIEKIVALKEEAEDIKEKLEILEQKNKCIQIAKSFLENAYEKMKSSVTPKFTQNLSSIVQNIANQKYQKVSIHEEKGLIVEDENGQYIPASLLSTGTIDQLYLALRLSMLNEITKEKMPIILDETFAYFDDERLKNILQYLVNEANEHQIILLTCTGREKELLEKMQIDYQWIEL